MFFLDANTCIYCLNERSESIRQRILSTSPIEIKIPAVVKAELLLGAYKSKTPHRSLEKLEGLLQPFEIVPFDEEVAYEYASIRKQTEKKGTLVGPNDLMIAAIVKFHEGILVTNNTREFSRIDGLRLENWRELTGTL